LHCLSSRFASDEPAARTVGDRTAPYARSGLCHWLWFPLPLYTFSDMPSIPQLEKLLAIDPGDAFLLYALAQEHAKAGDTPAACDAYDRCLVADPAYCYAYYHKARTLMAAHRRDEALATVDAGLVAAKTHNDLKARGELEALRDEIE
jgi:tetratricopeptide (TPR) repeat protein